MMKQCALAGVILGTALAFVACYDSSKNYGSEPRPWHTPDKGREHADRRGHEKHEHYEDGRRALSNRR